MSKIGLTVLMDEHVCAGKSVNLAVELNAVQLFTLDLLGFTCANTTCFADHVAHGFYKERSGTCAGVKHAIVFVYS